MTIAAGFKVRDGIVMCADTMYTAAMKIHADKLFAGHVDQGLESGDGRCSWIFALAGNEAYAKMAIDDCIEAILALSAEARNSQSVKSSLRAAIKRVNDEYVDTRPAGEKDLARFELLIAVATTDSVPVLYSTSGPALMESREYECIGSGAYLGHYLIRPAFSESLTISNAVLIAAQALAAAKEYDASCGGRSTFMVLHNDLSITPITHYDFRQMEAKLSDYEQASKEFLLSLGNPRTGDAAFNEALLKFTDSIREIRRTWEVEGEEFEAMVKSLEFERLERDDD